MAALTDDDATALLLAGFTSARRVPASSVIGDLGNVVDDVDVVVDCVTVRGRVLPSSAARVVRGPTARRTNVPMRSLACRWLAARIWAEERFRGGLVWLTGAGRSWIPWARRRLLQVITAAAIRVGLTT